jgi:hypothetical protein
MEFLHDKAISDGNFYGLRLDLTERAYDVGVLQNNSLVNSNSAIQDDFTGVLTLELADFVTPDIGGGQNFMPPPDYPSLAEKQPFPTGLRFSRIQTSRITKEDGEGGVVLITFSPKGFSDFAALNIVKSSDSEVTILVDPFSGLVKQYAQRKDFKWAYGESG